MNEGKSFPQKAPINNSTLERKAISLAEVLDGRKAWDLKGSMHFYELESGDSVVAGTDKGIGYKDHNEDRVITVPDGNFVAVVDGMGGHSSGELAAQILAKEFLAQPTDILSAVSKTKKRMTEQGVGDGGAVFISARIVVTPKGKFLDTFQQGDAKLLVIKKNGNVSFESEDDSLVQNLIKDRHLTPDEALYDRRRNIVTTAVSLTKKEIPKSYPPEKVEAGDLVLLMSDGLSDNFTADEIAKKVKEGLSAKELFIWLSDESDKRMLLVVEVNEEEQDKQDLDRAKNGVYPDGYKSRPKSDNRALVIMEIKGKTADLDNSQQKEPSFESTLQEPKVEKKPAATEGWTAEKEKMLSDILKAIAEEKELRKELDEIERNIPREFDIGFLEDKIKDILSKEKSVTGITSIKVEPLGMDMLILNAEINAKKFLIKSNIKITDARFVNKGDGIALSNYLLQASKGEEKIKGIIDENMATINQELKEFIEKETGKKVRKIWIEDGQLKALLD